MLKLIRWPHLDSVVWPEEHDTVYTKEQFCRHRTLDLLGALALIGGESLLCGHIMSYGAGHQEDLQLLHNITAYPLLPITDPAVDKVARAITDSRANNPIWSYP